MPLYQRGRNHVLAERPYQDGPGAKLYVAAGTPADIVYRPPRAFDPRHHSLRPITTRDLSVATVNSPDTELTYNLPAELIGVPIAVQVRTFADDYENETIYRPWATGSDGSGEQSDTIQGTATILSPVKQDAGGMSVAFWYYSSRFGIQPTQFALVQTSGPGSLADVVIDVAAGPANVITIDGLTDATAYGWNLEARSGAVSAVLGAITFTADAAGPSGITSFSVEPY